MVSLTRSWFTRLPHGTDMLAQDIKLPFVPLKVDAYHLLQALSGQPWGRRLVMTEPGLCEYLLNRSEITDRVLTFIIHDPGITRVLPRPGRSDGNCWGSL